MKLLLPLSLVLFFVQISFANELIEDVIEVSNTSLLEPHIEISSNGCADSQNPYEPGLSSFKEFKEKVIKGEFVEHASQMESFIYSSCFGQNDILLGGFIDSYVTQCARVFERSKIGDYYDSDFGNSEEEIKAKLADIISKVGDDIEYGVAVKVSEKSYKFVSGSEEYTYDLNYPALANPVAYSNALTGESYQLSSYVALGEDETVPHEIPDPIEDFEIIPLSRDTLLAE